MDEARIFDSIKQVIVEVMTDLDEHRITRAESLRNLGTNSLDRADILMQTMEAVGCKVPLIAFAEAQNIGDIVAVFANAVSQRS